MESEVSNIAMQEVVSSQIFAIGFDASTGTMAVRFKKGDQPTTLYHYSGVSQEEFDAFKGAESVGSHFYRVFKPAPERYPYRKIVE
ncbi:Uncharacterised protein [Burkholderia pseudomallei]|nr:Uncharacterised protein [Burkholderia pseudomallei]